LQAVLARQKAQLAELIDLINGPLSKNDRKKLITLCTIDVHARDVVARLIAQRCDSADAFPWQSQLRYGRDDATGACRVSICDADFAYGNEYIGNCGCLCITPLTDRCYITLTQAQRLVLGAPLALAARAARACTRVPLLRPLSMHTLPS
jgi:dynein heavy chain